MATTSGATSDIIEHSFTCPIDFEVYNETDRKPMVIVPCGHSICEKCLSTLPKNECPVDSCKIASSTVNYALLGSLVFIQQNQPIKPPNPRPSQLPPQQRHHSRISNFLGRLLTRSSSTTHLNKESRETNISRAVSVANINKKNHSEPKTHRYWYWKTDVANTYEKYPSHYQSYIQNAFLSYVKDRSKNEIIIRGIKRKNTLKSESYAIDFKKMKQLNLRTRSLRDIITDNTNKHLIKIIWYSTDTDIQQYEASLQTSIEKSYQFFCLIIIYVDLTLM